MKINVPPEEISEFEREIDLTIEVGVIQSWGWLATLEDDPPPEECETPKRKRKPKPLKPPPGVTHCGCRRIVLVPLPSDGGRCDVCRSPVRQGRLF